jgi:hypothetical protein
MTKRAALALLAAVSLLAACGRNSDDGSPTAAENDQLNQISSNLDQALDTSPDSLVVEDPTLGNGDSPAANDIEANAAANGQ